MVNIIDHLFCVKCPRYTAGCEHQKCSALVKLEEKCERDWRGMPIWDLNEKQKQLCQNWGDIGNYLSDAHDDIINKLGCSERAIIMILQQGGSLGWRLYQAMPEVIDPLLKRIIKSEGN